MASYKPVAKSRSVSFGRSNQRIFSYANEGAPTNAQVAGPIASGTIPNTRPQNNAYWTPAAKAQRRQEMMYGLHLDPAPKMATGPYTRNAKRNAFRNTVSPSQQSKPTLNYSTGQQKFTKLAGINNNNNINSSTTWCDPRSWSCFRRRTRKKKTT
jgi:hypothetical protein